MAGVRPFVAIALLVMLSPMSLHAKEWGMPKGSWMFTYKYMFMDMDGNRDGTGGVTTAEVLRDFRVSPLNMTMDMHMVNVMYGVTDDLTLMLMVPYIEKSMDHVTRTGFEFTTKSDGVGDVSLVARLERGQGTNWYYFFAGVRAPTGSIARRGPTPAGPDSLFPYPMQIGTGTYAFLPGFEYVSELPKWRFGARLRGEFNLGDNDHDYKVGNKVHLWLWNKIPLRHRIDLMLSLDGHIWNDYQGADPGLNPAVVPTAATSLRGGERVDALIGLNLYGTTRAWDLRIEAGLPVYQSLDGPQLETDLVTMLRFRWFWF